MGNYRVDMDKLSRRVQPVDENRETINSVETSFEIISELMDQGESSLPDLVEVIDLSKSSIYKHLYTLQKHDFVTKAESGYKLGLHFLDISGEVRGNIPETQYIKQKVRELAVETGETAQFAVAEHGRAVIIFREAGENGVYSRGRIGKRFYIHQTSTGKAMLSHLSNQGIRKIVDIQGLPGLTDQTITEVDALIEEIDGIRAKGYAINRDESIVGLSSVGVPLTGPGEELIGAVAVIGPSDRLQGEVLKTELPKLIKGTVNEIELNLMYS